MKRLVVTLLGLVTALPAQAGFWLLVEEDGGTLHREFTDADGTFHADGIDPSPAVALVHFVSPHPSGSHWWDFRFATLSDALIPGPYDDARGSETDSPAGHGLWVVGDEGGCYDGSGRFDVLEAERAPDGSLRRFAAHFALACPGRPILRGTLYFDASGPPFPPPADSDGDGVFDSQDLCVDVPDPDQADADFDRVGDACDPSYDVTYLLFDSTPGDWVGQGLRRTYTRTDGGFHAMPYGGGVRAYFDGGSDFWSIVVQPPQGQALVPGVYEGASRFPSATHAGLEFSGDGRGCAEPSGRFEVLEIATAATGEVERLAVDFLQRCGATGPAVVGSVRWNASLAFGDLPDADGDGVPDVDDVCPTDADPAQADRDWDGIGDACEPAAQAAFVLLDSEPGDFIGQGQRQLFSAADATITATAGLGVWIEVHVSEPFLDSLSFFFDPPFGERLKVGTYSGAMRSPFQEGDAPGLSVFGSGRGCNTLTGWFEVLEHEVDARGRLRRFAADFEQHCEGAAPALRGSVRYGSSFYAAAGDRDGDGVLDAADACPDAPDPTQADADADGLGDACHQACDADGNGAVDLRDVGAVFASLDAPLATPVDVRDADADGQITVLDARVCALRCTADGCEETSLVEIPTPEPAGAALGAAALLALGALQRRARRAAVSSPARSPSSRGRSSCACCG